MHDVCIKEIGQFILRVYIYLAAMNDIKTIDKNTIFVFLFTLQDFFFVAHQQQFLL